MAPTGIAIVRGMQGLGDNVYQVPVVKWLTTRHREVYIHTPWPQLYRDLHGVRVCSFKDALRTQQKNQSQFRFERPPLRFDAVHHLSYVAAQRKGQALWRGLAECVNMPPESYHLALSSPVPYRQRVVVVRPATVRREWMAPARNPRQEYIQTALDVAKARGYCTVVVADIAEPDEVYDGFRPEGADVYYERGELRLEALQDLVRSAHAVISGVGFMAPLCMAVGTPALIIHGGAGGWNAPEIIDAPAAGKLTHLLPTSYCRCQNHQHACDKIIPAPLLHSALDSLLP